MAVDAPTWIATGAAVLACLVSTVALVATQRKDKHDVNQDRRREGDSRIDERIRLATGEPLARMQSQLDQILERLPSFQEVAMVGELQRRVETLERERESIFQRLSAVETKCARTHGGG